MIFSARNTIGRAALALAVFAVAACSSFPAERASVDGRVFEFTAKPGPAPVIFENGLGGKMDWWRKVYPVIAEDHAVFAYNRAGYGQSTPAAEPRDTEHITEELRAILRAKGFSPPYILVGHSFGGLIAQYYARKYPEEVSALVLVDSTHPRQLTGPGAIENWPGWFRCLFRAWSSDTEESEMMTLNQSGAQVLALPPFKGPVFVLSAAKPLEDHSEMADDANEKRRQIARMYPNAKQIWVDSGHGIPLEKPEAVIEAIRQAASQSAP